MASNDNKDIRLKDVNGNYLYPLAHCDDMGQIIRDTYLMKTGDESYIAEAKVEKYVDPQTQAEIQKLTLINRNDVAHPIEFLGGDGGYAAWGFITGDVNDQTDLTKKIDQSITIKMVQKNKIFRQATLPVDTSEQTLNDGDLWYVTGYVEGYTIGKWYVYVKDSETTGNWVETTDAAITENTAKIELTERSIATEVTERTAGEAVLNSRIEQTAMSITSEVGIERVRYFLPTSTPPEMSSELIINPGDLWYCSEEGGGYTKGKWYVYKDGAWVEATDEETRTAYSKIEQNADSIRSEVSERKAGEGEIYSTITQTAGAIMTEVATKNSVYRQPEAPVMSSALTLYEGDLWFCTNETEGYQYKFNKWYIYKNGEWEEATDQDIKKNSSRIEQTDERITTEVERLDGDIFDTRSKIEQTASSIIMFVESKPTIFEGSIPPESTSEHTIVFGDLWLCTTPESSEYVDGCYYRYDGEKWVETTNPTVETAITRLDITDGEILEEVAAVDGRVTTVKTTADGVQAEVADARGGQTTLKAKIGAVEASVEQKVDSSELNGKIGTYITSTEGSSTVTSVVEASGKFADSTAFAGLEAQVNDKKSGLAIKCQYDDVIASINASAEKEGGSALQIKADKINFTGVTTFVKPGDNVSTLTNDKGYQNSSEVTTIVGNTINTGYVNALHVNAGSLTVNGESIGTSTSNRLENLFSSTINGGTIYSSDRVELANGRYLKINGINDSSNDAKLDATSIYILDSTGGLVKSKTWSDIIDGSGGGEPDAYLKSASVSGNTLTLTNKDGTEVTFTPTATFG